MSLADGSAPETLPATLADPRMLAALRRDMLRFARLQLRDAGLAEDAVQEALFTASRRLMDLRQLECFASWLFRIVKRECNRLKRGMRTFLHEPITEDIAAACVVEHRGLARDLAAALESLPAHYREVVLMRDLEGLTIEELSERLGLTREATKARLHRARSLAREYLKD